MVKRLVNINGDINKKIEIYMAYNGISNKAEAIELILDQYFMLKPPRP